MRRVCAFVFLLVLTRTTALTAQDSRAGLIERARNEFNDTTAITLLLAALDPALGAPDSLWAVAGYDLAATLTRVGQENLAGIWLRWIARHGADWPIDTAWFPSTTVRAATQARTEVAAQTTDAVQTGWRWSTRFEPDRNGTIQVANAGGAPWTLGTEDGRAVASTGTLDLPPGTWTFVVSAEGFEPLRTTREILPGVTTLLNIDLLPVLTAASLARFTPSLIRLTRTQAGQQVCSTGFVATDDGLVLTSLSAVPSGVTLEATSGDGRALGRLTVAVRDSAADLAVLRLDSAARASAFPRAPGTATGGWAWSVRFDGCGGLLQTRTRLGSATGDPRGTVQLEFPLTLAERAAPIVDPSGLLLGIVDGPSALLPAAMTDALLERARRETVVVQVRPRRGFPWGWTAAGVAAAGLAVVLAGGGGGDGSGDGGGNPGPTTGGIIITFPN